MVGCLLEFTLFIVDCDQGPPSEAVHQFGGTIVLGHLPTFFLNMLNGPFLLENACPILYMLYNEDGPYFTENEKWPTLKNFEQKHCRGHNSGKC